MSWIIGMSGRVKNELVEKVNIMAKGAFYNYRDESLCLWCGGNRKTCIYSDKHEHEDSFIAAGVAFKEINGKVRFLSEKDWTDIDSADDIKEINGHFTLIKWNAGSIKIFTDQLGIRDIYYRKITDDSYIFSTRGDWVTRITNEGINYSVFGAKWMLCNQLSAESIFTNIHRLNSSSTMYINRKNNSARITTSAWRPEDGNKFTIEDFANRLDELTTFPLAEGNKMLLSLSGGLDSRLLLSFLIKKRLPAWSLETIGDGGHPDSVTAKRISEFYNIKHEQLNEPLPGVSGYINDLENFVLQTTLNNSALGYCQLRNLNVSAERDEVIIDGGCGEIWRGEFFRRMKLLGKEALLRKNIKGIIPYLENCRGDFFNEEITAIMKAGCEEQLAGIFEEMPPIEKTGVENWIDIFAIKTKMMNNIGGEQIRMDYYAVSYMPLIQPMLLNNLLSFKGRENSGGRRYKEIIKNNSPELTKFPLVKGTTVYPYYFAPLLMRGWRKVCDKLKVGNYKDETPAYLMELLREYILDLMSSDNERNNGLYRKAKLNYLKEVLYEKTFTAKENCEIFWWLAFDLFRKSLRDK